MSREWCECTDRDKVIGVFCRYCEPQMEIGILHDVIKTLKKELKTRNEQIVLFGRVKK